MLQKSTNKDQMKNDERLNEFKITRISKCIGEILNI